MSTIRIVDLQVEPTGVPCVVESPAERRDRISALSNRVQLRELHYLNEQSLTPDQFIDELEDLEKRMLRSEMDIDRNYQLEMLEL